MNRAEVKRRQAGELSNILTLITVLAIGNLIGENGITYIAAAVEVYMLLWEVVGGSLSDTLGKLLRSRRNKGQYKNAEKMRRNAMIFQAGLGLAGSLILLAFAQVIAGKVFGLRYSALIIMVLSPVVLLRSISSVLLGYFQGAGTELPGAASGILRQILILCFGIMFAGLFGDYGEKVSRLLREDDFMSMHGGVGVAVAIVLTELLVVIALALIYRFSSRSDKRARQDGLYSTDSFWDCVMYLCNGRFPQALAGVLACLPLILGLVIFGRTAGGENDPALEYGIFIGRYLAICGIVVCLISMTTLPMTARILICLRREENRFARSVFQGGVHICLVHGIFASVFLAFMGTHFAGLFYAENGEIMLKMLQGGSCVVVFLALSAFFGRLLRTSGKRSTLLAAVGIADIVFTATVVLMRSAGVLALAYGGMTGTFVLCLLLGMFSYRQMRLRLDWLNVLIVPSGAALAAGLVCMLLGRWISPHLGSLVTLIVTFILAASIYWSALLLLRNFREQELEIVPGGRLINMLGQMLRVY